VSSALQATRRSGDHRVVATDGDNVIDLQHWRAQRRPEQPPGDVLAAIDAAALVYDALIAQGHEVRFELPEDEGGRVRAELRSTEGDLVRTVALFEVVGLDGPADDDPPAIA
jgi:hypothetical protein